MASTSGDKNRFMGYAAHQAAGSIFISQRGTEPVSRMHRRTTLDDLRCWPGPRLALPDFCVPLAKRSVHCGALKLLTLA